VLVGLAVCARAQVGVGENTEVSLSGDVGFGYNQMFSDPSESQWGLAFDADLTGYYYNPKFLAFRVSPYYNQNRVNTLSNSIFAAKGIFASGDLFSGSNTPISFTYQRDWNSEGTFNLPGTPGFTTNGNSQMFTVTGGAFYKNMPSVQASFSKGSDTYEVLGADANGASALRLFNVTSNYSRWGFDFGASYSNSHLGQETPLINGLNQVVTLDTNTNTWQFNVARDLWRNAHWNSSFARTHYTTASITSNAEQSYDSIFNTLTWQPTDKVLVAANMSYTDNAGSYLLTVIPGGNPGDILPLFNDSNYLMYGVHATYTVNRNITLDGGASQTAQSYFGVHMESTNEYAAVGYNHGLFGGQFGAHYGISHFSAPFNGQTSFGNLASATYTKRMAGWQFAAGGNVNTNQMTALLSYHQSSYSVNLSASRSFHDWLVMVSGVMGKNTISGLSGSDGYNNSYSFAVSHRNLSFNGSFNHSSGESLPTPGGFIPVPIPIPGLLVTYNGSSYAFGGGYQPVRRLQLTASYSHSLYETGQPWLLSNSMFTRLDARAEYTFRQMHITGAFTHLNQGLGVNFGTPQTINAVYFSISRHFDIF
jgi:hypothetical protein